MNHFEYVDGVLSAEGVSIPDLAQQVGTPFYCYSTATLERHYKVYASAFDGLDATVCYALKANSNQAVIKTLAKLGAGADVVSVGEMRRALRAGIAPSKVIFSGVGKADAEMREALEADIAQINVESIPELIELNRVALDMGKKARIALRINPHVDAKTHEKIATGKAENKFGIDWTRAIEVYRDAAAMDGIDVTGIAMHIGSQLTDLTPFREAFTRLAGMVEELRTHGIEIKNLDLGGGLGIAYQGETPPLPDAYGQMVRETVGHLGCHITLEPGRLIVGNAGILVSRVMYIKDGEAKRFVILDAAMNDLIRPTLYNAYHEIIAVNEAGDGDKMATVDVVGPVCETGDTFGKDRKLPDTLQPGDLVAICSAGAYGAVMSSTYNTRALTPEVLVSGDKFAVIRERQSIDELIGLDKIPGWLD
ncbi:diaminopimelate decarboxylase [Thalassospira profundimaris]|uniref:Diaminopimelate decarboxylase n=1 Tax=Thalassospira profundimaris TaxID=502049 RepID=A0A367X1Z6_9PROT|nr:diaminopimelate decarboxylase [Thalassospira profundimaris]RCK47694.1 diaminopimelate decarboxylase [Thalassospira profundimaris]